MVNPALTGEFYQCGDGGEVNSKRIGRLVIGCTGVVIGAGYAVYALFLLPFGSLERPGAAAFPFVLGIGFVIVSILTCLEALFGTTHTGEISIPSAENRRTLIGLSVILVLFVVTLPILGQYVASMLFMIAAIRILGSVSMFRSILWGTAIGFGISWFFMSVLGVLMPTGIFKI